MENIHLIRSKDAHDACLSEQEGSPREVSAAAKRTRRTRENERTRRKTLGKRRELLDRARFRANKRSRFYKLPLSRPTTITSPSSHHPRNPWDHDSRLSGGSNKAASRQFGFAQISSTSLGVPETCLYNSAANPVMARKTCFPEQFAERRVHTGSRIRLRTFMG